MKLPIPDIEEQIIATKTVKQEPEKSPYDLVESRWEEFKTQTPVENLISGQGTFKVMSNFSEGLICAKKELFNNNYDPEKVVKCFLLIDFQRSLIGIRSIDT